jgi:hypothetical protein
MSKLNLIIKNPLISVDREEYNKFDIILNSTEFSNLSEDIKNPFVTLYSLFKEQSTQIKTINDSLLDKISKNEFNIIQSNLDTKISIEDVNYLINTKFSRISNDLNQLKDVVDTKLNKNIVLSTISKKSNKIDTISSNLINKKVDNIENELNNLTINIKNQFKLYNDKLKDKVDNILISKISDDINKNVNSLITDEINDIRKEINEIISTINKNFENRKNYQENLNNKLKDNLENFQSKINEITIQLNDLILKENNNEKNLEKYIENTNLTLNEMNENYNEKFNEYENQLNKEKNSFNTNYNILNKTLRTLYNDFSSFKNYTKNDLNIKPNISDINLMLKDKVDISTINDTKTQIDKLNEKINLLNDTFHMNYNNNENKNEIENNSNIFSEFNSINNNNNIFNENNFNMKNEILNIKNKIKKNFYEINKNFEVVNLNVENKLDLQNFKNFVQKQEELNKLINTNSYSIKLISNIINNNFIIKWTLFNNFINDEFFLYENYNIKLNKKGFYYFSLFIFIENKDEKKISFPNIILFLNGKKNKILNNSNLLQNQNCNFISLKYEDYLNIQKETKIEFEINSTNKEIFNNCNYMFFLTYL